MTSLFQIPLIRGVASSQGGKVLFMLVHQIIWDVYAEVSSFQEAGIKEVSYLHKPTESITVNLLLH